MKGKPCRVGAQHFAHSDDPAPLYAAVARVPFSFMHLRLSNTRMKEPQLLVTYCVMTGPPFRNGLAGILKSKHFRSGGGAGSIPRGSFKAFLQMISIIKTWEV